MTRKPGQFGGRGVLPTSDVEGPLLSRAVATDLERRVWAHERILQSLIAHISEAEPHFLDRLRERFCDPIGLGRSEHDYVGVDAYADAFIKAIDELNNRPVRPEASQAGALDRAPTAAAPQVQPDASSSRRVAVRNRSGVWEVRLDGQFYGDYVSETDARSVASALEQH